MLFMLLSYTNKRICATAKTVGRQGGREGARRARRGSAACALRSPVVCSGLCVDVGGLTGMRPRPPGVCSGQWVRNADSRAQVLRDSRVA